MNAATLGFMQGYMLKTAEEVNTVDKQVRRGAAQLRKTQRAPLFDNTLPADLTAPASKLDAVRADTGAQARFDQNVDPAQRRSPTALHRAYTSTRAQEALSAGTGMQERPVKAGVGETMAAIPKFMGAMGGALVSGGSDGLRPVDNVFTRLRNTPDQTPGLPLWEALKAYYKPVGQALGTTPDLRPAAQK